MNRVVIIISVLLLVALTGCVSYVTPARYQESSPIVKDYTILGFVSVDMPVVQPTDDVKGVKEMALAVAREQYPDADDIIDVTITEKAKHTYIFFGLISDYRTTLEGNAIRYNN